MVKSKRIRKAKKHSGRVYADSTLKIPKKEIIDLCLEPEEYWDDWVDWRDGSRTHAGVDRTKLSKNPYKIDKAEKYISAQKKKIRIRKARKNMLKVV